MKEIKDNNKEIADEALFNLGKLNVTLKDNLGGIESFRELVAEYPSSPRTAEAQLRIGELYETLIEDYALAEKEYEALLINYPNSIYIDETRKRIRQLLLKKKVAQPLN